MSGITHRPECVRRTALLTALREAYLLEWPLVCRACSGMGGHAYEENVGERDYPIYSKGVDECVECQGKGLCPRCGSKSWSDEDFEHACIACNWRFTGDFRTDPYDCDCYELDLDEGRGREQIVLSKADEEILDRVWGTVGAVTQANTDRIEST